MSLFPSHLALPLNLELPDDERYVFKSRDFAPQHPRPHLRDIQRMRLPVRRGLTRQEFLQGGISGAICLPPPL